MLSLLLLISLTSFVSSTTPIYYTSCAESATRPCTYGTNVTARLLSLKKGGSNVLSTSSYDSTFFPCEQYNYDCAYAEVPTNFITIANGVQLNITYSQLTTYILPTDTPTANQIKPFLGALGSTLPCVGGTSFALTLTDAQCLQVLTGYLNRLASNLSTQYTANQATYASTWANININIKTAVIEMAKYYMNTNFYTNTLWTNFLNNNYAAMSSELKSSFTTSNCPECLHSAYLIDSVTTTCNKYQSVNFLIDQSGSIGSTNFQYALNFLITYVNQTFDDLSIMSINFFDTTYQSYINYGNNRATILSMIAAKPYRSAGTMTGLAINKSIALINSANYPSGVPKLLVILTDGGSFDNVVYASNYARAQGITIFCVGIGGGINTAQLLQIAGDQSNVLYISNYGTLSKLASLISNYFCHTIVDVNLYETIIGNVVRVPTSPNYYRVQRSNSNIYYQLIITYQADPNLLGQIAVQSHYDPFPDNYSLYPLTQNYLTSPLQRAYFISPQATQNIPIKKNLTSAQTPGYAFVSIGGTGMDFNITLQPCTTATCATEIQQAQTENSFLLGTSTINANSYGPNIPIFAAIAVGIVAMGLCTFGLIAGLRKLKEAPEEEKICPEEEKV